MAELFICMANVQAVPPDNPWSVQENNVSHSTNDYDVVEYELQHQKQQTA